MLNNKVKPVSTNASHCAPELRGFYPDDSNPKHRAAAPEMNPLTSRGGKITASRHEIIVTLTRSVATTERRANPIPEILGAVKP